MNYPLYSLDKTLKLFLTAFLFVQMTGVITGLIYLEYMTHYSTEDAVNRYRGTEDTLTDEFNIPEEYAKPVSELLITTHNHVIGFALLLFTSGIIFYFNSLITGFWKKFLLIEPLISTLVSFGSLWLVRFVHQDYIYITVISAVLLYASYFLMCGISIYEMIFIKKDRLKGLVK
jgi:hypothetical protein